MSSITVEDAQPSIAPEIQQHEIGSQQHQTSTPQPSEAPQEAQHAHQAGAPAVPPSAEALPALFWDSMPEEGSEHTDSLAMNAMMAELGPVDKAINFKVQGNDSLKRGLQLRKKFYLRQAQEQYSQGLAVQCGDSAVDGVLYSNRAQVELQLGNYRNALTDSVAALRLDSSQVKACFRGATAALRLKEWERATELSQCALSLEPGASEFVKLLKEAEAGASQQAELERVEAERRSAVREPARQLAATLLSRGWSIGLPQVTIGARKPELVEDAMVSWPVLFIYPASMQTDSVEAFHELHTFADHLDVMFGPEAPALEWDSEHSYTRDSIELYYLSNAAKPLDSEQLTEVLYGGWPQEPPTDEGPQRYGKNASGWVALRQSITLGEALSRPNYVVPGVPVFFVVAKGTAYRERFLAEQI